MYRKKKGSKKSGTRKAKAAKVVEPEIEDVEQEVETIESTPVNDDTVNAVESNPVEEELEVGLSDDSSSLSSEKISEKVAKSGSRKAKAIPTQQQAPSVNHADPAVVSFAATVADAKRVFTAPFMIYDRDAKQIVRNPAYNRDTTWTLTRVQGQMMSTLRRVKERETLATPRELLSLVQQAISGVLFSFTNVQPEIATSIAFEQTPLVTQRTFPFASSTAPSGVVDPSRLSASQLERFNEVLSTLVGNRTADPLFVSRVAHCLTQSTAGSELLNQALPLLRGRLELEEASSASTGMQRSETAQAALRTTSVSIEDLQSHLQTLKSSYEALAIAGGSSSSVAGTEGSVNVSMVSVLQESIYALVLWSTTVQEECASLVSNTANIDVASTPQAPLTSHAAPPSLPPVPSIPPAAVTVTISSYNPETGHVTVSRDTMESKWGLTFNRNIELVGMVNALRASGEDAALLNIAIQTFKALPLMELNGKRLRRISSVSLKENGSGFETTEEEGAEEAQHRQQTMSTAVKAAGLELSFTIPKIERNVLMRPHETDFVVLSQGGEEAGGQTALFALQRFDTSIDWGFNIYAEKNEVEMVQHNEEVEGDQGRDTKGSTVLWTETQWHMRIDVQQLLNFTEESRKPKKSVVGGPVLSQAAYDFLSAHKDRLVLVKVNNVSVQHESDEKAAQAALEQAQVILLRVQVLSPAATTTGAIASDADAEAVADADDEAAAEPEAVADDNGDDVAEAEVVEPRESAQLDEVAEEGEEGVEAIEEEAEEATEEPAAEEEDAAEEAVEDGEEEEKEAADAGEEGDEAAEGEAVEGAAEGQNAEVDASYMEGEEFFDTSDSHGGGSGSVTKRIRQKRTQGAIDGAEGEEAALADGTNEEGKESGKKKRQTKGKKLKKKTKGGKKKAEKAATEKRGRGRPRKVVADTDAEAEADAEEDVEAEAEAKAEKKPKGKKSNKRLSVAEEVMLDDSPSQESAIEEEDGAKGEDAIPSASAAATEEGGEDTPVVEEGEKEGEGEGEIEEPPQPKKRGRKPKVKQVEEEESESVPEKKLKKASKKKVEIAEEDLAAAKAAFEETESNKLVSSETPGEAAMRIASKAAKEGEGEEEQKESEADPKPIESATEAEAPIVSFDKHTLQSAKPLVLDNNVTIESFDGNTLSLQRASANVPWGLRVQMGGDEVRLMSVAAITDKQRSHPFAKVLESNTKGWTIAEINKNDVSMNVRSAMDAMKKAVKLNLVLRRK